MLIGSTFAFGLYRGVRTMLGPRAFNTPKALPEQKPNSVEKRPMFPNASERNAQPIAKPIAQPIAKPEEKTIGRPIETFRATPPKEIVSDFLDILHEKPIVTPPKAAHKEANFGEPVLTAPTKVFVAKIDATLVIPAQNEQVYDAVIVKTRNGQTRPKSKTPFYLYCTKGEFAGNRIEIPQEGIIIGRNPSLAHLIIQEVEISGKHLKINPALVSALGITIEDFGSTNGSEYQLPNSQTWTKLQGRRIFPPHELQGIKLRLAEGIIEFEIRQ